MAKEVTRLVAIKVPIICILNGKYIRGEGDFSPNYIELEEKKISRVNIIGIVVSIQESGFSIDDGSARVSIRSFEQAEKTMDAQVGDIVNVIGRPREFSSERYIVPEIIKITNEGWMRYRKKEVGDYEIPEAASPEEPSEVQHEEVLDEIDSHEKIIRYIKSKDEGKGIEIEDIITNVDVTDTEKVIESMLKEGEVFENIPGKIKVLE